ncbi:MAG: PhzF family phenazine biosynthesis protein [Pseudomonadales bacterium]|nr:PhzF family phenazine biosynthesis protein [Pseudomonadales bacterium]
MDNPYYVADVFTREKFNGAQIAVLPNSHHLNDQQMQLIARELNLSETVFVAPKGQGNSYAVRIFSPQNEIDFAGHPIIATAFILASSGELTLTGNNTPLTLVQNTGPINANVTSDNGQPCFVQFSQQASAVIDRFAPTDQELAKLLSIDALAIDSKKYSTRLVSCGFPYLIVPVFDFNTVRNARFNYSAWSQSTAPQTAAQEILLFSEKNPQQDANFNARLLGPAIGIHEDPPVGSAMPAFASYLSSFEHTREGTHTFSVDRGDTQNRRSVINLEMDHKHGSPLTVRIGGDAVLVAQGSIATP